MKQSKEILGKPIISILDGKDIGKVKNFVINPDLRSIEFLIVQNDQWEFGIKAIPFKLVEGLGDYAVTIESSGSVIDLADIPIANDLLTKHIQIKGTRIISKKGHLVGQVSEYYFAQETGKILGCLTEQQTGESLVIPEDAVVTFGKDITVVTEDGEKQLWTEEGFRQKFAGNTEEESHQNETIVEKLAPIAAAIEEVGEEINDLVGRKLGAAFYDLTGNVLLAEGEEITEEVIAQVKQMGRNKALELALKVEV